VLSLLAHAAQRAGLLVTSKDSDGVWVERYDDQRKPLPGLTERLNNVTVPEVNAIKVTQRDSPTTQLRWH
jgi:hypothetical protein